jgi:hypothetical protein
MMMYQIAIYIQVSKTGKASPTFIKIDAYFDLLYSMYLIPILTAPA